MRIFASLLLALSLLFPLQAAAQSTDDEQRDRSYLQGLLEDNLSGAGRDVRINGFSGALSARAAIETLTIADADGIWLTLTDVVLDWDRTALFSKRLDVTQLTAAAIVLDRLPVAPITDAATPEATPFSLPELPVAVQIRALSADTITLGESLLGEEIDLSLEGSLSLAGGEGTAKIAVTRLDGPAAELSLDASYANLTRDLALSLVLAEEADGIAAKLIGLPGNPAIDLELGGTGPLQDYTADVRLATDGQTRLAGEIKIQEPDPEAELPVDSIVPKRMFSADIGGDIAPVFLPEYQDFFGSNIQLMVSGTLFEDQSLKIDALDLRTAEMQISGDLALDAAGWPQEIALTGEIASADDTTVLLPLPGLKTRITRLDLGFGFDAAVSDSWQLRLGMLDLTRDDLTIDDARITGRGTLTQGDGPLIGQIAGALDFAAQNIAPSNVDIADAIGPKIDGTVEFSWAEATPLKLSQLAIKGADYDLGGDVEFDNLDDPLNLLARFDLALRAADLTRFSGVAGRPLTGAATLDIAGQVAPLSGAFEVDIAGQTNGLTVSQPQADPLIDGQAELVLQAARDADGLRITQFAISSDAAKIAAQGSLKSGASTLALRAEISELAVMDLGLSGAANVVVEAAQNGALWQYDVAFSGPGAADVTVTGAVEFEETTPARVIYDVTSEIGSLAAYSALAKRDLGGGVALATKGWFDPRDLSFAAEIDGTTQDVKTGSSSVDQLLVGAGMLKAKLRRNAQKVLSVEALTLETREITAQITGAAENTQTRLTLMARLRDLGLFAPGFSGAAELGGTAVQEGAFWRVDLNGTGPGGTTAAISGMVAEDASQANLSLRGGAPVALANAFIAPNAASGQIVYDLTLSGPLALSSLSGQISSTDARFFVPSQQISFAPVNAQVRLSGGQANLDITAQVTDGGQITARGPVSLSAPYSANLDVSLADVALSDSRLYTTTVSGAAQINGPLTGGAKISADLQLGPTELQIPEGGTPSVAILSDLKHVNEPAAVRRTRAAAGFIASGSSGGPSKAFPLDVLLRAPSRIFIRGRGLDAELGGQLRLTGTTANVVPLGRFDLIRGRLDILGKRLELTEGFAQLQGSLDPYVRLVADTDAAGTDIRIAAEGPASEPEISFSSSPELPEDEVLALLLFERSISKISPLQALQLAAAIQTLAGGGSGLLNNLRAQFGLDDLDVTTSESGATGVRVGKYLTENIYSDVTAGSDGNTEVNLNLTITPSVTARGSVGSDGESRLGIFFERDY